MPGPGSEAGLDDEAAQPERPVEPRADLIGLIELAGEVEQDRPPVMALDPSQIVGELLVEGVARQLSRAVAEMLEVDRGGSESASAGTAAMKLAAWSAPGRHRVKK